MVAVGQSVESKQGEPERPGIAGFPGRILDPLRQWRDAACWWKLVKEICNARCDPCDVDRLQFAVQRGGAAAPWAPSKRFACGCQTAQSYTQWVPLHDPDLAMSILPIGQSERPGHASRTSTLALWSESRLHPAPLSRAAVEKRTHRSLLSRCWLPSAGNPPATVTQEPGNPARSKPCRAKTG